MAINYREDPTFNADYVHPVEGGQVEAPFSVAVFGVGKDKPFLGVGLVVGTVETGSGSNPVIEVEDIEDGRVYTLRGIESWWAHPIPEEIAERIADGSLEVDSVRRYVDTLPTKDELSELGDSSWLEDGETDPES